MLFQAISSICSFAGVAFLFSYFVHPQPIDYIKYKPSNTVLYYCLIPIIIIAAIPFVQHINTLISQIPMGTSIRLYEEKMDELFKGLMQMHNGLDLVARLFVLAIVPAICEEYFFRGVLLRLLLQIVGHPGKAILLSSLAFALIHMEPHAFLSLCLSGIMLGYIYLWTGSLRYSIFAHALFNGIQILIEYMAQMQNLAPIEQLPAIITITAILLFIASFYFLFKHKIEAPENWLNNFRDEPNNI
jgi:membrane protease YdiL (CAAX protease family)